MGSMHGEMSKIKDRLQAVHRTAPQKIGPGATKTHSTGDKPPARVEANTNPPTKSSQPPQKKAKSVPPRTFTVEPSSVVPQGQKNAQRQVLELSKGRDKKDLSTFTPFEIPQLDGEKHTVFVKRIGSTAGYPKQNLPAPLPTPAVHPAAQGKKPTFEKKPTAIRHIHPQFLKTFDLSRSADFKLPDGWVQSGSKCNLVEDGDAFDAIMGIDFGTAYTKASVGFGSDVFIVDWDGVKNGGDKHVLAGEFSVMQDGSCVLGRCKSATRVGSNLKLPFLEHSAGFNALADATVFLALVIRYIRAWWFHNHAGVMGRRRLQWVVNLGAPTTPWEDSELRSSYERAITAAWRLSRAGGKITVKQAEQALRMPSSSDDTLAGVEIVPEFVAQIASYTRSVQRQPDLHMLMDIGAGTVDVVTFNVHRDEASGEDKFPIFCGGVYNLGTHFLISRRLQACTRGARKQCWDDASRLPTAEEFCKITGAELAVIDSADRAHTIDVAHQAAILLLDTRQRRYRQSPNWTSGIPVFLCGGGSVSTVFSNAPTVAAKSGRVPLAPIRLPVPSRLQARGLDPQSFHRVSVAYGLGMDAMNLGEIIPAARVTNEVAPPLPTRPHITDWEDG